MVSLAISSPCSIRRETLRRNCSESSVTFSSAASNGYFLDLKCSACLREELRTLIGPMVIWSRPWSLIATSICCSPYFAEPASFLAALSRFQMAQSRFFRNTAQFGFRYAEQKGGSGLSHEFWDLIRQIVHGLPTICTAA